MQKIFLFGCGEIGKCLLYSLLENSNYQTNQIVIVSRGGKKKLADSLQIECTNDPKVHSGDIILLAIPPQAVKSCLQKINFSEQNFIISTMAGYATDSIAKFAGNTPIIRSMPNLLIKQKKGLCAYFCSPKLDKKWKFFFLEIFNPISEVLLEVKKEEDLDIYTAVLGSGVGFCFFFLESYYNSALKMGISEKNAKKIICYLFKNSSIFAEKSNASFMELVKQVATQGGTTQAGINFFQKKNLNSIINQGILVAYQRSKELVNG